MKTPKYFDKPNLEERVPKIKCIKCNQMHFLYEKLNASLQQNIRVKVVYKTFNYFLTTHKRTF